MSLGKEVDDDPWSAEFIWMDEADFSETQLAEARNLADQYAKDATAAIQSSLPGARLAPWSGVHLMQEALKEIGRRDKVTPRDMDIPL